MNRCIHTIGFLVFGLCLISGVSSAQEEAKNAQGKSDSQVQTGAGAQAKGDEVAVAKEEGESLWYVMANDQQQGPFTKTQVRQDIEARKLNGETLVRREENVYWLPIRIVTELDWKKMEDDSADKAIDSREGIVSEVADMPVEASEEEEEISEEEISEEEVISSEEEEFELDDLEDESESMPKTSGQPSGHPGSDHGVDSKSPFKFKIFFDLKLEYEFETELFQFTRDHAHIMLEVKPLDWLGFRTDVAFEPEFFELMFFLGRTVEIRAGKILVPFGQNDFHHMIGGRVDTQSLFLPDIWGDYGLCFKHMLFDGDVAGIDYSIWATNGFQEGVSLEGDPEPRRQAGSLTDNNQMKGVGFRPEMRLGRAVTIGTSWYLDAWDEDNDQLMLIYGADLELGYGLVPVPFLKDLRIRAEIAWSEIQLPNRSVKKGIISHGMRRSGYYGELSYRPIHWLTFQYREGRLNADSRVADANDMLLHEPSVIFRAGPANFSLVLELHQILSKKPYPDPEDYSKVYLRIFLRF